MIKKLNSFSIEDLDNLYVLLESDIIQYILLIMQTMRREIDSFVARKSFKYNDVIDSKIVNLDIWHHFRLLDELNRELKSNSDSRSISSQIRRLILSNWVESEDWYQVIESSQNVDMKTWLDDQSNEELYLSEIIENKSFNNHLYLLRIYS